MKENIEVIKGALDAAWSQIPWLQYVLYVSVISIIALERDKTKKLVYGIFSLLLLVMLFNPLTVMGMKPFFGAKWIYYVRLFLIIPIPVIMAYGLSLLFDKLNEMPRLIVVIIFIVGIVLKGDYIYDDVSFKKAENFSKIPEDIAKLADLLSGVQGYKTVLVSSKNNIYIRQIDPSIILPFGRADAGNKISEEIDSEDPDAEYVIDYVVKNNCDYFMANRSDSSINRYLENDCTVIGYTDNYALLRYNDSTARTYDKYGNLASVTFTDSTGKAEMRSEGYATVRYTYDIDGRKTREAYEDENNNPIKLDSGYAGIIFKYNRKGRLIEKAYYNEGMELTINDQGFSVMQIEYNDDNYETKRTYLDTERKPLVVSKYGYATIRFERTSFGGTAKEMYYDEADEALEMSGGYCGYEQMFNEDKKLIERTYIDSEGKPVVINSGYATIRWEYNDRGEAISTRYFDEKGNPAQLKSGEYGNDSVYDESGREIERIYVDEEGAKSPITTGYDTVKYERDGSGKIIKEMYFYENEPFSVSKGYFGAKFEHDSNGRVIKGTYIDSEGEAMMIEGGYSWYVYERDSEGFIKRTTYFDLNGNVVLDQVVE